MGECAHGNWLSYYNITDGTTVTLVGKTGNGKSATGNSIIEANVFDAMPSSACVTKSCHSVATTLHNGRILNVIDTPGSFDISVEPEIIGTETGIHAVLVVLSLKNRFSVEESWVIESLMQFFGAKLSDYMIVVFTHGDVLEDMSLDQYLGHDCPEKLTEALELCGNRFVVFDNVTEDKFKKFHQREELLRLVDEVVAINGGIPYTDKQFVEVKEGQIETSHRHTKVDSSGNGSKFSKAYQDPLLEMGQEDQFETSDEQTAMFNKAYPDPLLEMEHILKQELQIKTSDQHTEVDSSENGSKFNKVYEDKLLEMESNHREMFQWLEKKLADEQVARMQAEAAEMKSNDEISKLREDLERAQKMIQEMKYEENQKKNNCGISPSVFAAIEHQIESKLSQRLENQLAEKFGRMQAEEKDEMRKLREDMENQEKNNCAISEIASAIEHQIERKLRERILRLEKLLADENAARVQAEDKTKEVEKKSKDEISKLREELERAQKLRIHPDYQVSYCPYPQRVGADSLFY